MKLFNFAINDTGMNQIFKDINGNICRVPDKGVIDTTQINGGWYGFLKPVENFMEVVRERDVKTFYLERTFSLGDTLMLIPVYRRLEALGYKPYLRVAKQFCDLLERLEVRYQSEEVRPEGLGVFLNYLLERDHTNKKLQKIPRVQIYFKAIGLPFYQDKLDWDWEPERFPEVEFSEAKEPFIVFQGKGNTERRGLPNNVIQEVIKRLNRDKISTFYIGQSVPLPKASNRFTRKAYLTSTLPELFSWIGKARCLITMDSSPLWVSHFTKTPTIAVLAPSRPEERLVLHPLFPEGATAVEVNKWIKCPSCFEQSVKCNHKFDCFKVDPERLYSELKKFIMRYWG